MFVMVCIYNTYTYIQTCFALMVYDTLFQSRPPSYIIALCSPCGECSDQSHTIVIYKHHHTSSSLNLHRFRPHLVVYTYIHVCSHFMLLCCLLFICYVILTLARLTSPTARAQMKPPFSPSKALLGIICPISVG